MTEDDYNELDRFLLSGACGDEALSLDEAHGYLTALLLQPEQPAAEQWLGTVWREPCFSSEAEQRRLQGLLTALYDEIAETLAGRRQFEPMVVESEEEGQTLESYEGWCFGFMLAVEENPDQWQGLPKSAQGLLAPMAQLALLVDEEGEEEMSEEEYSQWVELIPGAVLGLYDLWHGG